MKDIGTILGVVVEELKSAVAETTLAGATSIPLGLLVDFDPSGGSAVLGDDPAVDTVVSYIGVDYDLYALLLESPLAADVEVDTPVKSLNALGQVEREKRVLVDLGEDEDDEPVEASVDTRLDAHFSEGDDLAGLFVEVETDGDAWNVVSTPFDSPDINPAAIDFPVFLAHRVSDTAAISTTTWHILTWGTVDKIYGFSHLDASAWLYADRPGWYDTVSVQNWQNNTSGARRARLLKRNLSGAEPVVSPEFRTAPDATAGDASPTLVHTIWLEAGEAIAIQVWQSSGAGLAVTGDAAGNRTTWSVNYRGAR